jgi:hypothetical protein
MNTTSIFVELLVIGFHTLTWIGLLIITIIGYRSINLALPILAMTYVLGVAIDRLSDMVFLPCDHRLRDKEKLKAFPEFLIMRFYILGKSKDIYAQLEYTRSRLRIMRAATLNFVALSVVSTFFVWFQLGNVFSLQTRVATCILVLVAGGLLAYISYKSWVVLTKTYIKNTIAAYRVLQDITLTNSKKNPKQE